MMFRGQSSIIRWLDRVPDLTDLRKQRLSDREILKLALEDKARLTRDEVRELAYKSAGHGQFFTPAPAADLVAFLADIDSKETVLDPSCGLGALMFPALQYSRNVEGIELMQQTAGLASKVLGLNVRQGNFLELPKMKSYDVVVANPPFGKINSDSLDNWNDFTLNEGKKSNRTENLFLELCLRIAKRRVVMIAPDSLLSCPRDKFVRKWLLDNFGYRATISLPRKTFWKSTRERNKWTTPATNTKTSIMVVDKTKPPGNYKVLMAILQKVEDIEKVKHFWNRNI